MSALFWGVLKVHLMSQNERQYESSPHSSCRRTHTRHRHSHTYSEASQRGCPSPHPLRAVGVTTRPLFPAVIFSSNSPIVCRPTTWLGSICERGHIQADSAARLTRPSAFQRWQPAQLMVGGGVVRNLTCWSFTSAKMCPR